MASEDKRTTVDTEKMEVEDKKVEENKTDEQKEKEEVKEKEEEAKKDEGPSVLDLAFAMDCTGSMGSYIHQATQNIRTIVERIVSAEKADVRLALVEYRDHPPQDSTFVTRVHDFTPSVKKMKEWLASCSASGGGDTPEAVADAMHQVLKLSWRDEAAKVCVFISDAPPHGLSSHSGDGFPNGCPDGLDPMEIANQIGEKGISMYMVGCEPSITPYRDWFMAVAHITNGQYVPLASSTFLSDVIIGGAQEEIALQRLLEEVNQEVQNEAQAQGGGHLIDEEALSSKVHTKLQAKGASTRMLQINGMALEGASSFGKNLAAQRNMADVKKEMDSRAPAPSAGGRSRGVHKLSLSSSSSSLRKKTKKKSSGLLGWFGFGSGDTEETKVRSAPIDDVMDEAEYEAEDEPRVQKQEWNVATAQIQQEQSSRLVSRAMKMNKFK